MLKEAKENIKNNPEKDLIKKTATFNKTHYRRNINKTRAKLRSLQKNSLTLLNHIIPSDDKELLILKQRLLDDEQLKNDYNAINLIYLINQLNGAIPKNYFDIKDPNNDALYITKKIYKILKNYKLFFFFFSHYKIDDKTLIKLIPLLEYHYYKKNNYIFKEGDNATQMSFILKGKISFSKKINSLEFDKPQDVEQYKMGEGRYFGEWDLVFCRKNKVSALCLENCHIIHIRKEYFQKYIQEKFTKIESDTKTNLVHILSKYIYMPQVKLERFVISDVKMLFFKKSEIIYNEREENRYLYLIYDGEANLLKNISKGEDHSLVTNSFDKIKVENIQKKAKNINYKEILKKPMEINNNQNLFKLDLQLNKNNYQIVSTLGSGSFAGLEIVTGVTYFKYTLISNTNFTSIYRINLKNLEEHLKEFMLNLIPLFFELEEKIHTQIDNIKYIDSNIVPNLCQKYKNQNNKDTEIDTDENDETFLKQIKKIENKFDKNEGGFVKMNNYNNILQKQINLLKDQLKENQLKDKKIDLFVKKYEKEQLAKLKYKKVRLIHSAKSSKNKNKQKIINKNNSFICSTNNNKNRPISCVTYKGKNTSIMLKEGKDSCYNLSKSNVKSANNSIIMNKRKKNFNLFYKEEINELQNELRKKMKKPVVLLYKMPKTKLTINKIKQSLSVGSKDLVKSVFIKNKRNCNKNTFNSLNYKFQSSIFPYNKKAKNSTYKTINICKNNQNNIFKLNSNLNINEKQILNLNRNTIFDKINLKKIKFYDTGLFDMPLAVQLGVN